MSPTLPRAYWILLSLTLGFGSVLSGGGFAVESDPAFDLSQSSTYSVKAGTPARRVSAQTRIESALRRDLQTYGLREVEENSDLIVVTHVLPDVQTLDQLSDESYWEFITGVRSVDPYEIRSASLVIDLVDRKSQRVVWRGVAAGKVKQSVDANENKIDKIVAKLIRELSAR
ncbi:MAG: DUF4136 domain-containing protein [Acidobacteriota bacterium]|nr:DUF4136 domain-containing protein [Acidobacteriota bacterium]MDH3784403.1 DUF4136 domain-containing protein [Acidobacteriota bacterium]